jgi:hypothetical protein
MLRTILKRHDALVIELRVEGRDPCIEGRGSCQMAFPRCVVGGALQSVSVIIHPPHHVVVFDAGPVAPRARISASDNPITLIDYQINLHIPIDRTRPTVMLDPAVIRLLEHVGFAEGCEDVLCDLCLVGLGIPPIDCLYRCPDYFLCRAWHFNQFRAGHDLAGRGSVEFVSVSHWSRLLLLCQFWHLIKRAPLAWTQASYGLTFSWDIKAK